MTYNDDIGGRLKNSPKPARFLPSFAVPPGDSGRKVDMRRKAKAWARDDKRERFQ